MKKRKQRENRYIKLYDYVFDEKTRKAMDLDLCCERMNQQEKNIKKLNKSIIKLDKRVEELKEFEELFDTSIQVCDSSQSFDPHPTVNTKIYTFHSLLEKQNEWISEMKRDINLLLDNCEDEQIVSMFTEKYGRA